MPEEQTLSNQAIPPTYTQEASERGDNLLFVDTESDIETKEIISIQTGFNGVYQVLTPADSYRLYEMWNKAAAVIFFNAPYDMGVLSTLPHCKFTYTNDAWNLNLWGMKYRVKRINGFRNLIQTGTTNPPVIDLLKLWSILIDDSDISLKSLIKKELHETPIPFTPENSRTYDYQIQDVKQLDRLWFLFLQKVNTIPPVTGYTLREWSKVCTPATFAKRAYKAEYPNLQEYQKWNDRENKKYGLRYPLEQAYNGGITFSFHRGTLERTAWYDIHGAYAHVIEYLNVDRFKKYSWEITDEYETAEPLLCGVNSDVFLTSINQSLKIFRTRTPAPVFMWNYDIEAMKNIFPDARIDIKRIYRPVPLLDIPVSLSAEWSHLKEEEERQHGKTTLRDYYKFMSNTSYGITAQRNPYRTIHTNMCIAGMITSRTHLILSQMIKTARLHGYKWVYSDTDSICITGNGNCSFQALEEEINRVIFPYSVACEFIGTTRILSLKRYHAYNGRDTDGHPIPDKTRLHGKSVYKISEQDMKGLMEGTGNPQAPLIISQAAANTARTYNRVLKLNPKITNPHPFMFETRIDTGLLLSDWFDKWISHIDRKTTIPDHAKIEDEFSRDFITFRDLTHARFFYSSDDEEEEIDEIVNYNKRIYDLEDILLWEDR